MPQVPTIGRIVHYRLSEMEAGAINEKIRAAGSGNMVQPLDIYPAVIVRAWGKTPESACNLQVLLDAPLTFWVTSVSNQVISRETEPDFHATEVPPRSWMWPPRV